MVMSAEQTAGLSHTMKVDNSSIERAEEFKYLGTTLTNQNSIQEEIKSITNVLQFHIYYADVRSCVVRAS